MSHFDWPIVIKKITKTLEAPQNRSLYSQDTTTSREPPI
jgi:hypothetical protein